MPSFHTLLLIIAHSNPKPGDTYTDSKGRKIVITGPKKKKESSSKKNK